MNLSSTVPGTVVLNARLFGCPRGHQFTAPVPFTITFGFQDGLSQTGPLCPECVVVVLNHLAAATELPGPVVEGS